MGEGHERYEALAMAHALGGLTAADAAMLRAHLVGCAPCRARVAELQGLDLELAAAARDERRRRPSPGTGPNRRPRIVEDGAVPGADGSPVTSNPGLRRAVRTASAAVLAVMVVGVGFWNLHLRASASSYFAAAAERGAVLEVIASGTILEPKVLAVAGRVAVTSDEVAIVLTGLGPLRSDERLVLWTGERAPGGGDDPEEWTARLLVVGPREGTDVVHRMDRSGASIVHVTVERGILPPAPAGRVLLSADLPTG
jgi:hypothetical protein